jgi:radical SAM superfamily enzyme YgiQ (UPF0313 family)
MDASVKNCLFVYPRFTSDSFWNYRETCDLVGAKYPEAPLGLITVAAMLPGGWGVRLNDLNVGELNLKDVDWADLVFIGGQIFQQSEHLHLIDYFRARGKTVITGGPDATSSPHLYDDANHQILGEAEVTLPEFLRDYLSGGAKHRYEPGERKADMHTSPTPRFDLLKFSNYLNLSIQWNRGCPFMCEFCDIIELFGRKPRGKTFAQLEKELRTVYELGYRGQLSIVDDNFIGNKKAVKELLPQLIDWQKKHDFPFDFSTEASLNLSDDDDLLNLMEEAGFTWLFTGIETPDKDALLAAKKHQNAHRSIPESIHKINRHGMIVMAGYIVGFDGEKEDIAERIVENIEQTNIAVNMVGLLLAVPNTQMTRRLKAEGRLDEDFETPTDTTGDQCVSGLNFTTIRPRLDILRDYGMIVKEILKPKNYFNRVLRSSLMLRTHKRRQHFNPWTIYKDLKGLLSLTAQMMAKPSTGYHFWRVLVLMLWKNPQAFRDALSLMALYLHFQNFRDVILQRLETDVKKIEREGDPRMMCPYPRLEIPATPSAQPAMAG